MKFVSVVTIATLL